MNVTKMNFRQQNATEDFAADVEGFVTATLEQTSNDVEFAIKLLNPFVIKRGKNVRLPKKLAQKMAQAKRKMLEAHRQLLLVEDLLSDVAEECEERVEYSRGVQGPVDTDREISG